MGGEKSRAFPVSRLPEIPALGPALRMEPDGLLSSQRLNEKRRGGRCSLLRPETISYPLVGMVPVLFRGDYRKSVCSMPAAGLSTQRLSENTQTGEADCEVTEDFILIQWNRPFLCAHSVL